MNTKQEIQQLNHDAELIRDVREELEIELAERSDEMNVKTAEMLKAEVTADTGFSMEDVNDLLKLSTKNLSETQYRHYRDFNDKMANAYGKLIALKMIGAQS